MWWAGEGRRGRVVAARGLAPGTRSRTFTLHELAEALCEELPDTDTCVYVSSDGSGRLASRQGAARAAARARLAPHGLACTALLDYHDDTEGGTAAAPAPSRGSERLRLRLVVTSPLAPHAELLLWLAEPLLARVDMPVLTPLNIHESAGYVCQMCGARYELPNALKLHLWLSCAPPAPDAFWRRLLGALARPPAAAAAARLSAFRPYVSPPAVEALATAWARAQQTGPGAGHVCVYCGKLYSRRYGLKIHIRTHTGYKPLRCRHCARAFGDPSNLNKHLRLHAAGAGGAGGRHVCARCGAALARRRDLERHVRARHCPHRDKLPASP